MMRDRLCEHRLSGSRRAVQEHATRRIDANLRVQVMVRERQLDRFADLLLLLVAAANVIVRHIGPLVGAEH